MSATGAGRFGRALTALRSSLGLDLKLGIRMLLKYPMLTLIGGIAIAVATAIGAGASEFMRDLVAPSLPLAEGDRIVRLYHMDRQSGNPTGATLYDLEVWRESLSSMEIIGGYSAMEQGIESDQGEMGSVNLARISPSAFRIAEAPPLMGRFLLEDDVRADAPEVIVLGFNVWRSLLGADPGIVGRTVEISGTPMTVVGVMPEGYAFPQTQNAWVPLRADAAALHPASAPAASIFGRLAPGATMEMAQAELEIAGQRAVSDFPTVYENLEPRVAPLVGGADSGPMAMALTVARVFLLFLLVVITANVATLVFARTVAREGEIAVRMALGATRRRLILQFVAEALVLVGGATLVGVLIARLAMGRISRLFFQIQQEPELPFWWSDAYSFPTLIYVGVLVVVGTVIVGVLPAIKATRGDIRPRLGRLATGEAGGLKFGGIWTAVIIVQVALTVAFIPIAVTQAEYAFVSNVSSDFPAEDYYTAQLGRDVALGSSEEVRQLSMDRSYQAFQEVRDRLIAEPEVVNASLASGLSAMNHVQAQYEFRMDASAEPITGFSRMLLVDRNFFDVVRSSIVAGQGFGPGDFSPEARRVIVNEAFVEVLLEGRNPVGALLRVPEREPGSEPAWVRVPAAGSNLEIIGLVSNPGIDGYGPGPHPVIYAPLDLSPANPVAVGMAGMPQAPSAQLLIERAANSTSLTPLLYEIASSVDPQLRLSEVGTAAEAWGPSHTGARVGGWIFMAVAAIVLMLSAAGIFALMSFTVSRRTREIAIRMAVGAPRSRIVRSVFGRAGLQVLLGVVVGAVIAVPTLAQQVEDGGFRTLAIVALLLLGAGLAACLVPVRRVLRIAPAAAMKSQ